MRIWISENSGKKTVNFQSDNPEEVKMLDKAIGFKNKVKPIGDERDKKIGKRTKRAGELGGHESQRWIIIY
jgi:hypothetical protein